MFNDYLNAATTQTNKLVEDMQSLDWKYRDTIATACDEAAVAIAGERWLGLATTRLCPP